MKKILLALLFVSTSAFAQHGHHHHGHWRHGHGGHWNWVVPAVVGGVIAYEIAKPRPPETVIITQPPPYTVPPVSVTPEVCSPWTQIVNADGTVTYTRTCQR